MARENIRLHCQSRYQKRYRKIKNNKKTVVKRGVYTVGGGTTFCKQSYVTLSLSTLYIQCIGSSNNFQSHCVPQNDIKHPY